MDTSDSANDANTSNQTSTQEIHTERVRLLQIVEVHRWSITVVIIICLKCNSTEEHSRL